LVKNNFALLEHPQRTSDVFGYSVRRYYYNHKAAGAPSEDIVDAMAGDLVTADAVLDYLHWDFSGILEHIERHVLKPRLAELLAGLQKQSVEDYLRRGRRTDYRLAVLFSVGQSLFSPTFSLPSQLRGATGGLRQQQLRRGVLETLKILRAGINGGPYSGLPELDIEKPIDWGALKPRGHYDDKDLRGYFRAVKWLSLSHFPDSAAALDGYLLLKRAELFAEYKKLFQLYELLAGQAEFGHLGLFAEIAKLQPDWFVPAVNRSAILARVEQQVRSSTASTTVVSPAGYPPPLQEPFYVFSSRWAPDVEVLDKLAFSDFPVPRQPWALDVMATLGSKRAQKYAPYKERFPYASTVAQLRTVKEKLFVPDNAYRSWLWALETLVADRVQLSSGNLPRFFRNAAYQDKMLNTALASYAALKHDTMIMTRPPRVRMGGVSYRYGWWVTESWVLPPPPVYVEPNERLYLRLGNLCAKIAAALRSFGGEAAKLAHYFESNRKKLIGLRSAVRAQLDDQPLSKKQVEQIRAMARYPRSVFQEANPSCLIADLWSLPGQVHAIAIGKILPMVAVAPFNDRQVLVWGDAYTFYEADLALKQRPTDDQWCELLREGKQPPRPVWTSSFIEKR